MPFFLQPEQGEDHAHPSSGEHRARFDGACHRASLGGVGIVGVWLQRSRGWSAVKLQLGFDSVLMLVALAIVPPAQVLYSALGVLVLNLVLLFNHRPGRYMGV